MAHCTEGLTVVARGGAVSWHEHCTEGLTLVARGVASCFIEFLCPLSLAN